MHAVQVTSVVLIRVLQWSPQVPPRGVEPRQTAEFPHAFSRMRGDQRKVCAASAWTPPLLLLTFGVVRNATDDTGIPGSCSMETAPRRFV